MSAAKGLCVLLCLSIVSTQTLLGWNATGHKSISFLAYSLLKPSTRARVDAILSAHPDYAAVFAAGRATDPIDIAHNAFTAASTWPDVIKGDPRFSESASAGAALLPGFPDMLRHQSWHYIDVPYPPDFSGEHMDPVNALTQLKRLLKSLHKDGAVTPEAAFALPWILHLVTDIHQPLHTVSRFSRNAAGAVEQDKGGNACFLQEERNLHSLWDNILGTTSDENSVARLAASLRDHFPEPKKLDLKPETWVREGTEAAAGVVYNFSANCRDREHPAALPPGYREKAHALAIQRGALAAYRLAALLNDKLGD